MPWSDLETKDTGDALKEHKDRDIALAKAYHHCFSSGEGKKVLDHMITHFLMSNDTNILSPNVNYEAAYRNGEAGVVKYILHQIKKAGEL